MLKGGKRKFEQHLSAAHDTHAPPLRADFLIGRA